MSASNQACASLGQTRQLPSNSYAWLALMVLLWGASWPVTKLALAQVSPLWLATIRFASAGACLFVFLAVQGRLRLPPTKDLPIVLSIGLLQMMTFTGLGMIAMVHIDASRAVLLAYTTPLWCVMAAWVVFKERPSKLQLLALLLGLVGIAVICSPAELDWSAEGTAMGAAFLLLAAISWAVVILHVKRHRWTSSPIELAPWQMLLASVPLAIVAFVQEGSPANIEMNLGLVQMLVFIGPIATSACFVISAEHGRRISTFEMSNFTLGVPLVGIALSQLVLNVEITGVFTLGLCLVVAGVLLAALAVRRG